jgi:hypothetical protein
MRASNGVSLPRHASTVIAPATIAAANARSAANSPTSASAVDTCVPFNSARPSFGPSTTGDNRRCAALGAGQDVPSDDRLAFADQHQSKMGQRREIARRSDRALRRNARHDAGVGDAHEELDQFPADARVPARQRHRLQRMISRTDAASSSAPVPAACERTSAFCSSARRGVVDARTRQQPEAGVDAIDGAPFGDDARDGRGGRIDAPWRRDLAPTSLAPSTVGAVAPA